MGGVALTTPVGWIGPRGGCAQHSCASPAGTGPLLLVTVIGHVILPRPRVRAREAALHLDELPVIQKVLRPSEVHLNPEVRHQLALLPRDELFLS